MEFSRKKLAQEAASNLRACPVGSVAPYALMLAPVYVFMKANAKFVAVKAPLDFFTPAELERWKPSESFYFPEFVDASLVFREAGQRVKALLELQRTSEGLGVGALPPAPFEISDAVLRSVAPLWTTHLRVEPFFIAVFANEVCSLLPGTIAERAREHDVALFELAVFRSSWAVFLALHLGYLDLAFLESLRLKVFGATLGRSPARMPGAELQELVELAERTLGSPETLQLSRELLEKPNRVSSKIIARLERVKDELAIPGPEPRSVRGERGFADG